MKRQRYRAVSLDKAEELNLRRSKMTICSGANNDTLDY
jgi:hypothetical protein